MLYQCYSAIDYLRTWTIPAQPLYTTPNIVESLPAVSDLLIGGTGSKEISGPCSPQTGRCGLSLYYPLTFTHDHRPESKRLNTLGGHWDGDFF